MKKSIASAVSKGLILLACSQAVFAEGVEYKVIWDQGAERYRVYMKPDATPRVERTLSAQVTLRIPTDTLPEDFTDVDLDLLSPRSGASWSASSRAFSPVENNTTDYISFTPTLSDPSVFALTAGEEQELFSFHTNGVCLGAVSVMDNDTDPFNPAPGKLNSLQSNPGNEFSSLMWAGANDFLGIYGTQAMCKAGATNTKPVAIVDNASVQEDRAVEINVLANDSDADGDRLTISGKTNGQHGVVTLTNDNSIIYSPEAGFTGTDTFTYTATDGKDGSATGTVYVTVTAKQATNNPPVAYDDAASIQESSSVEVNVLANDLDTDGDSLTINGKTNGQHGTVLIAGDNSIIYTPDAGFTGTDTFTYTVSDGRGGSATATVSVTVSAKQTTNNKPVAGADTGSVEEGSTVEVNVLANDSDADGDTLRVSAKTNGRHGTATLTYYNSVIYAPNAGFSGTDTFTYTVTDNQGGSTTGTVYVTVTAKQVINRPPVAGADSASVQENGSVEIDVLANDSDVEGDNLTLTAVGAALGGATSIQNEKVLYVADNGYSGTDRFHYTVSDADGAETTAQVTITVVSGSDSNPDRDGDGLDNDDEIRLGTNPDQRDSDGDSVSDKEEVGSDLLNPIDTDHDGTIDALDDDDDNDSILSIYENYNRGLLTDTDTDFDGAPDYLDPDDDNDGLLTAQESPDSNGDGFPSDARDSNRDGLPDYLQRPGQFAARSVTPVPTLGSLGMVFMSLLLAGVAVRKYFFKKVPIETQNN